MKHSHQPIGLTDRQMNQINIAAALLPPQDRDAFLRKLSERLGSEPSDNAVSNAISLTLPPMRGAAS
jgi:hypothetical protein